MGLNHQKITSIKQKKLSKKCPQSAPGALPESHIFTGCNSRIKKIVQKTKSIMSTNVRGCANIFQQYYKGYFLTYFRLIHRFLQIVYNVINMNLWISFQVRFVGISTK